MACIRTYIQAHIHTDTKTQSHWTNTYVSWAHFNIYTDMLHAWVHRQITQDELRHILAHFGTHTHTHILTGTITPDELRHVLTHFGEKMEPAEVEEYIVEADLKTPHLK